MKSKHIMIIEGLGGQPINELIEGWSFRIREVAPYVFRVDGMHIGGRAISGFGGTAEAALDDCIKKAERTNLSRRRLSAIMSKIRKIVRF